MGTGQRRIIDDLVRQGILTPDQAASATTRRTRVRREPCPACGERPGPLDYVCPGCSVMKAKDARRFWQDVRDMEAKQSVA